MNDDATTNDQWQPALAVTPDGSHVGIFWYDRRLDPANNLIDRYGAIGSVSGHTVTFGANFRITDVSFPPAFGQDPVFPPDYMGECDQAVADDDNFYTPWGDNRLGNAFHANQPDVRLAKIPVDWPGTNAGLLVASGVVPPVGSTAGAYYAGLPTAEMSALRSWPTRVVVGQEAASHGIGVRSSSATIADELQPADGNVLILRSDEQEPQLRTRDADPLAVDVMLQTFDSELLADELASALVP